MKDVKKEELRPLGEGLLHDTNTPTVEECLRGKVRELKSRIVFLEARLTKSSATIRDQAKTIRELEAHITLLLDCVC